MGGWHLSRGTPTAAFVVQAAIALALVAFGSVQKDGFSSMVEFTAPVFWFFFLLVGVSVFVLRAREPDARRPFRVPLYPLTPVVFVLVCAYLLYSSINYAMSQQAVHVSLSVMAAGVVALALTTLRRGARRPPLSTGAPARPRD
jgi:amino acid transporter